MWHRERTEPHGTLTFELEDAATRDTWVGTLGPPAGILQQWQFVGMLDDEVSYDSDTFSTPHSRGHLPLGRTMLPHDDCAPGMDKAQEGLLRVQVVADGWIIMGHGEQAWQGRHRRPAG